MPGFDAVFAGPVALPPPLPGDRATRLATLAGGLYGPVPPPPDVLEVDNLPISGAPARRLAITLGQDGRRFRVDAALWMPAGAPGPVPLVCGLDFVGPAGMLFGDGFPLDPDAVAYTRPDYGAKGRLTPGLRGVQAYRWPVPMLLDAGCAVLTSCYGSWVPDDADIWRRHGLCPLLRPDPATGAISLWAWALLRLLDVAGTLPGLDPRRMMLAGHSRLGKAALWAAAQDTRVAGVFANASGCGGAAPAAHLVGETPAQMAEAFPHWMRQGRAIGADDGPRIDQHHLLALIAPRALWLGCGREDVWADPIGSYTALRAAAPAWTDAAPAAPWPDDRALWASGGTVRRGRLGFHLRPGGHDLLPSDWAPVLAAVSQGWI